MAPRGMPGRGWPGVLAAGLFRTLLLLLAVALVCAAYFTVHGLPERLVTPLLAKASRGRYAFEASAANLDPLGGITLQNVRVYRKQVMGDPCVEAEEVTLRINPLAVLKGRYALRRVRMVGGLIRPETAFGPELAGAAGADSRPGRRMTVLELQDCVIRGIEIRQFRCRLLSADGDATLERIETQLSRDGVSGTVTGDLRVSGAERMVSARLTSELDPHVLLPLLDPLRSDFLRTLINRFEFPKSPPRVVFEFKRGTDPGKPFLSVDARGWIENGRYQNQDIQRGDGSVHVFWQPGQSLVSVDPVLITREDGSIKGGFTVDTARGTVAFDGTSTIAPKALAGMIGILTNGILDVCRFDGPVTMAARGVAGFRDRADTDLTVQLSGRDMAYQWFRMEECAVSFHMKERTNTFSRVRGLAYGGELNGSATFVAPVLPLTNTTYLVEGALLRADLGRFAEDFRGIKLGDERGRFDLQLGLSGDLPDPGLQTVRGSGRIRVREGHIFRLPVFGGFSEIMSRLVPGLDFVISQTDLKSEFEIKNGAVATDRIQIEGDVLSIAGKGRYEFSGALDFDAQVYLLRHHTLVSKVLRTLTYPISKLFAVRLVGTVDKPRWYAENFSRDLLERLGLKSEAASSNK